MTRLRRAPIASLAAVVAVLAGCERIGTQGSPHDAGELGVDQRLDRPPGTPASWAMGGGGIDHDAGLEIVLDGNGNVIVAGSFGSDASFGQAKLRAPGGASAIVIAKLDPTSGNFLWATPLAGTPHQPGTGHDGLAVDEQGNVFYVGQFRGIAQLGSTTLSAAGAEDVYVAKLDRQGNVRWAVRAGGSETDRGESAAVDAAGRLTITGIFSASAAFGETVLRAEGTNDLFVARLDAEGGFLWAKRAGSEPGERNPIFAERLALDPEGNTYLTGGFVEGAAFGAHVLHTTNSSGEEAFVAKLDPKGEFVWAAKPRQGSRRGTAIAVDPAGEVGITGTILVADVGLVHMPFCAKLDKDGRGVWPPTGWSVTPSSTDLFAVEATRAGELTVTGAFSGTGRFGAATLTSKGDRDVLLVRLHDPAGLPSWADRGGGPGRDLGMALTRDKQGKSLYVAGSFTGTATFGHTTLVSRGESDLFVWKTPASEPY